VDEFGLGTKRTQLIDEFLADFIATAGNDYLGALLGEGDGRGAANARRPPVMRTTGIFMLLLHRPCSETKMASLLSMNMESFCPVDQDFLCFRHTLLV
jgi:hypothetical protein